MAGHSLFHRFKSDIHIILSKDNHNIFYVILAKKTFKKKKKGPAPLQFAAQGLKKLPLAQYFAVHLLFLKVESLDN